MVRSDAVLCRPVPCGTMSAVLTMPSVGHVRCPACQSVDWFLDGCVIAAVDGEIVTGCTRIQGPDPALQGTTWSCNHCGHELDDVSPIALALDGIRRQTCDHPAD